MIVFITISGTPRLCANSRLRCEYVELYLSSLIRRHVVVFNFSNHEIYERNFKGVVADS